MKSKLLGIVVILLPLAYFYWGGTHFIGSEADAREAAIEMFDRFTDRYKLPREIFSGPSKPQKADTGYYFYWTLKPLDKGYPPVRIFASVHGSFNSDPGLETETLEFFKDQCKRDQINHNTSHFSGFCG